MGQEIQHDLSEFDIDLAGAKNLDRAKLSGFAHRVLSVIPHRRNPSEAS